MELEITFPGGKRVDAQFNGQHVKTDQPVPAGGEGSAPTPFQLFLASLGTCAGIYVLGFCQQRDIPTGGIKLVQRHQVDRSSGMVAKIEIDIQLPEDFPEQYVSAVTRSAEMCAVKKHLASPPEIEVITS
jgi:ribosomal protein S12 methylthiotransferase accessory factor